jgi:hypothetical protein
MEINLATTGQENRETQSEMEVAKTLCQLQWHLKKDCNRK